LAFVLALLLLLAFEEAVLGFVFPATAMLTVAVLIKSSRWLGERVAICT
jgi:hypothetical protein